MNRRVRTVPVYNDADYCGCVDPDAHYDEEPWSSMREEDLDAAISEYQDLHLYGGDIMICLLSPAGVGLEEWVPERRIGPFRESGYWSLIDDFILPGTDRRVT